MDKYKLSIEFDSQESVFYSGQKIKGCVCLHAQEELTITGVELKLFGGARIHWTEFHMEEDERTQVDHSAEEIYFHDKFILWGSARTQGILETLPVGVHVFPFTYALSPDIPCSFEGHYGWVRYYALCNVVEPGCKTCLTQQKLFTVLRDFDLNEDKLLWASAKEHKDCVMRSACCGGGKIACALSVPRSGYVPGEHIVADVEIDNTTDTKIRGCSLSLKQITKYGSNSHKSRKTSWELCRVMGNSVKPGKILTWRKPTIQVPSVAPSRLDGCHFVDIKYELVLSLDLNPVAMAISLPLILGTKPLIESTYTLWDYQEQYHCPSLDADSYEDLPQLQEKQSYCFVNDQPFVPLYKVYRLQADGPVMLQLTCSPGARRRRVTLSDQAAENRESMA